jgi:eukaryotic-like serine/threonine-protein kinase
MVRLDDPTIADTHATLRWQQGSWRCEDPGSPFGSYADDSYEPQRSLVLRHGEEAQLGACRMRLVSFSEESPGHKLARKFLARSDGLTRLLTGEALRVAREEDRRFAAWAELPAYVLELSLRGLAARVGETSFIVEMLAFRRVAGHVVNRVEALLGNLPLVAGRSGPSAIVISIVGHDADEVRRVVDVAIAEARDLLPEGVVLDFLVWHGHAMMKA